MNSFSPIGAGFRLVFRRPAIALAEIAWRWTFAGTAWFLGGGLIFEYLDSLLVGRVESFFLRTGHPYLVWRALRNLFQEEAIPTWVRERVPLVSLDGELVAVADRWEIAALKKRRGRERCRYEWRHDLAGDPTRGPSRGNGT